MTGSVRQRWGKVGVLCALLLVSACSSTTFVYNRLDTILPWYVDDYVELNREQDKYLDGLLAPFLAWHRAEELPRYVELVSRIEASLDRSTTPEDIAAIFADIETAWFRLEGQSTEWLLDLGGQLSDKQVARINRELAERQEEYEKEFLTRSDAEFYKESYKNWLDGAQDYLGRLSTQQRELLRESSAELLRMDAIWLRERAIWLQQLATQLERAPGWQQRIRDTLAARDDNTDPEYRRIFTHNMAVNHALLAQLLNGRSDKQDRRLRSKLADLREDLQSLIDEGRARSAKAA